MDNNTTRTLFERVCLQNIHTRDSVMKRISYIVKERGSLFDEIWFGTRPDILTAPSKEIEAFFMKKISKYETRMKLLKVSGNRSINEQLILTIEGEIEGELTSIHLSIDS